MDYPCARLPSFVILLCRFGFIVHCRHIGAENGGRGDVPPIICLGDMILNVLANILS